ncbi:MAG: type II methionyl aminopeptidase [Candidatus Thermoplasmatota archaeon]|nr:type II methionyl aminopeptidase [Candidatus Thermoplasmatota archaeon]
MDPIISEKYHTAGTIAAYARDEGAKRIKPDVSLLEVVSFVESCITEKGASLAFPVNIAINDLAAHFTPKDTDDQVFQSGDVVKLDVGAHIDGYIADTAVTIEIESNRYESLLKASEEALEKAILLMKPGVSLSTIGGTVQDIIQRYGFKPIENLTGHSLNRYTLHAGLSIPSVASMGLRGRPKVGDVIAVEPFATTGSGRVISGNGSNIYLINSGLHLRHIRDQRTKQYLSRLKKLFQTLPFSYRWCLPHLTNADSVLQRMSHLGLIHHYPQLLEQNHGLVSQKEHTIIITNEGCEVTTYGTNEG